MFKIDELKKSEIDRAAFKVDRKAAVDAIRVTVDGMVFDGDERSQDRMSRALIGMQDGESVLWVLADNTPTTVTKVQLREALRLAGMRQTELWLMP